MQNDPAPPVRGHARWLTLDAAKVLLDGKPAELLVSTVQPKRQGVYKVTQVYEDGGSHCVGYRLEKPDGATYFVSLGSDGRLRECNCDDARFRQRLEGCRHRRGLSVALREIGFVPKPETQEEPNEPVR